jgi:hypothetical protein
LKAGQGQQMLITQISFGQQAGEAATYLSNFFGYGAGNYATNASYSNFW